MRKMCVALALLAILLTATGCGTSQKQVKEIIDGDDTLVRTQDLEASIEGYDKKRVEPLRDRLKKVGEGDLTLDGKKTQISYSGNIKLLEEVMPAEPKAKEPAVSLAGDQVVSEMKKMADEFARLREQLQQREQEKKPSHSESASETHSDLSRQAPEKLLPSDAIAAAEIRGAEVDGFIGVAVKKFQESKMSLYRRSVAAEIRLFLEWLYSQKREISEFTHTARRAAAAGEAGTFTVPATWTRTPPPDGVQALEINFFGPTLYLHNYSLPRPLSTKHNRDERVKKVREKESGRTSNP